MFLSIGTETLNFSHMELKVQGKKMMVIFKRLKSVTLKVHFHQRLECDFF